MCTQSPNSTDSRTNPRPLCKSTKKDGSPCKGHGLPQFDGHCIAHGPADKVRAWRARGGKSSSTAARADKRIPERLKSIIDQLGDDMNAVRDGTLSPAAFNAICNGAKLQANLYRQADQEMDLIRTEEDETAAAAVAGGHGNFVILDAADTIIEQQNQHRTESLIDQGLATPVQTEGETVPVLTDEGRRRFGYKRQSSYAQQELDLLEDAARQNTFSRSQLPGVLNSLYQMRKTIGAAFADCKHSPVPPRDPLTGQTLTELPVGVKPSLDPEPEPSFVQESAPVLEAQNRQVERLIYQFEQKHRDDLYDNIRNHQLAENQRT